MTRLQQARIWLNDVGDSLGKVWKDKTKMQFFFFFTIFTKNVHLALNAVYLDVSKLIFISATKRIHHNMKHVCLCSIYPGTPEHILI